MSEQDGAQANTLQRPANDDKEAWKAYWEKQSQPWRTEPEIDAERQKYLAERRSIEPDILQGIYPFKDIRLSRADVEWLLATHEDGRGPVDWSDESQRKREGLDLRGANLREIDLQNLPLARLRGSLKWKELPNLTEEQLNRTAIHLEGADLSYAHLEGAILATAHLEKVNLRGARLEEAYLIRTHLEGIILLGAHLERANLTGTYLERAYLERVSLADEQRIGPRLLDTQWSNANLAIVDWAPVKILDDEYRAKQLNTPDARPKNNSEKLRDYEKAVRANRQLAVALQEQGLNEDAARFAYRAQKLQRTVFRQQRKYGRYLFSLFLYLLAGYGYKPWRSFVAYLIVIIAFATVYFIIGHKVGPVLSPLGSLVFSVTSFHGRGFFPGGITLDDPMTVLAALEAFVGLLIEVTFIATLTQRLFGR